MSDIIKYTNRDGQHCILNLDDIREFAMNDEKIALIKEYRLVTGKGLKDSKDAVESVYNRKRSTDSIYSTIDSMVELFKAGAGITHEPYTKQEFLFLVENAIDNMDKLAFNDMLEATMVLLNNVKNSGGLEKLAKDRDKFINNI
jgi:hypothetical protein